MDPLRDPLTEAELNGVTIGEMLRESGDGGALVSRVIVPKSGKAVREDGSVKVAIMRPCISRGARLRGLPPIYTPGMLAENADVFTGWPMFRDHALVVENAQEEVAEAQLFESFESIALEEAVKKIGRSVDDLAGRILRSWFDPELVYEDDSGYGYQPGGIVGYARLIKSLREKVDDDPGLMHLSINGYPKSGKPGFAPWSPRTRGMVVEGIRRVPQGSVDIVVRGGAGGRFLIENDAREVSSGVRYYDARDAEMDLSKMTPEQLREHITQHAPHLLPALTEAAPANPPAPAAPPAPAPAPAAGGLTEARVQEMLREAETRAAATRDQLREELRGEVEDELREERENARLASVAAQIIESAEGLPPSWKADLKMRWSLTESGASPALAAVEPVTEGEGTSARVVKTREQVLRETLTGDNGELAYARKLIAEAQGGPRVTGEGRQGDAVTEGAEPQKPAGRQWDDAFADDGMIERDENGAPKTEALLESLSI